MNQHEYNNEQGQGFRIQQVRITDIKIGDQFRKDMGNLKPLAEMIQELGVLQPLILTPTMELVHGYRTLIACRDILMWETIPARICPVKSVLLGQIAPNLMQKQYTVSERIAIADALRSFGHGGDRRSDQTRTCDVESLTVDEAAKRAGLGGKDGYFRVKAVLEKGVPELVDEMDRGERSVSVAAEIATLDPQEQKTVLATKREWTVRDIVAHRNRLLHREKQEEQRKKLAENTPDGCWTVTGDQAVFPCTLLIADPPFGITKEAWEPEDIESFTKEWCSRWSACGAHFIVVFWCQGRLREGRDWFDEALTGYTYQQQLIWHANNHCGPKSRRVLKRTWYPLFLYRRHDSTRKVISEEKTWSTEMHQLDCHVAPVPQTGYSGHQLKVHPCQKPVSVMKWLINALSEPGERVVSLFSGVSPCGIAAVQLGRRYHGIEINADYRRLAEERIAAYGRPDQAQETVIQPPQINNRNHGKYDAARKKQAPKVSEHTAKILTELRVSIEEGQEVGNTKEDVCRYWASFTKVAPDRLPTYLQMLSPEHQEIWKRLPDRRKRA